MLEKITKIINSRENYASNDDIADLGSLYVPSGKITVFDPLYNYNWNVPLQESIPTGNYPVKVFWINDKDWGYRIAFALLQISEEPILAWEAANFEKGKGNVFSDNKCVVETGLSCFADLESAKYYVQKMDEEKEKYGAGFNHYNHYIELEMKKRDNFDFLNLSFYENQAHNLIMFSTGTGDGYYPFYWGYAAQQQIACLMIDFEMIEED